MSTLAYKPTAADIISRLCLLHERKARDRIFAVMEVPSEALTRFGEQYSHGYCDYPDPSERIAFWDAYLRERIAVEDDSLPSAYLSEFDQGLYGGLVGGQVQFMAHPENGWISSMVAPLLEDWSGFEALELDEAHPWLERFAAQTGAFTTAAAGKFGISHFILIDGLNFVFELVGATRTYMSLIERPELVRRAIDLAFEVNVSVQQRFFNLVPLFDGGTFSNMVQWIPGRIVSESVDPFHMTSVDYFEEWGREPVERILSRFDGGVLHIHGNGRHLLEAVAKIEGLKAIFLGDDHGFPLAFDVLGQLQARTGDVPLVVEAEFDAFTERLERHELCGGVLYRIVDAPSADAANRWMEKVREYRL